MKASIRTRGRAAFALAFGILVAQPLAAATRTWSGADAGTNSSWSDASNWGGAAPSAGDDLVFPASPASFTNSNDIASATAFNSITIAGNYTLGGNALTLGSGGLTESGPATTATISLGITVNAPQTWTISNALTVTAAVSGNFEVTKAGSGTLTLPTTSSSIAFAGPVAVAAGTLLFNTGGTAMVISSTTVDAGATLEIDGGGSVSGDSSGNPVSITLNGSGGGGAGALLTQSAAGEHLIATVTLASDATVVGGFTIDGSINGPGAVTLEGNPATLVIPQLQLTGGPPNSYAGLTTTSYVTLLLNHGGTQPAIPGDLFITGFSTVQSMAADEIAPTATVTVDDGIWDLNGFTQTIGALTFQNFGGNVLIDPATAQLTLGGDVTSLGGCGLGDVYGPGPLSLGGGTRTFRVDASGCGGVDVIIDAPIVGTGFEGLTKDGSGILQLTAPNTYLGTTTVLGGGLLVDGAIGEVSLLGGTLGGTGSVGPINSIGGTLQPGDVDSTSSPIPGILTAGATALSAASTFAAVLNGTTVDIDYNQLNATGSVTLGSAALSVIPGYVPTAGDTYTIITSTTGISGTFAGLPDGSTLCANDYLFRVNYTSTSVTLTAVGPAPASHFLVSAPSSATAGSALSFTITALDACNNVVPSYAGTVHFTSSDGQSLLPADATFTGGAGTFSATLETAGPQTITVTDTVTSSITGSSSTIVVGPAAATHFAVSAPATATAGSAVSVTLTALDAFNNTATGYTGTVHFTATDGAAALPVEFDIDRRQRNVLRDAEDPRRSDDHSDRYRQQLDHRQLQHCGERGLCDALRGERAGHRDGWIAVQLHGDGARPVQQHRDRLFRHGALHELRRRGDTASEFHPDKRYRDLPGNARDIRQPDDHRHRHREQPGHRDVEQHRGQPRCRDALRCERARDRNGRERIQLHRDCTRSVQQHGDRVLRHRALRELRRRSDTAGEFHADQRHGTVRRDAQNIRQSDRQRDRCDHAIDQWNIGRHRGQRSDRDSPDRERCRQRHGWIAIQRHGDGLRFVRQHRHGVRRDGALHEQRRTGAAPCELHADQRHRNVPSDAQDIRQPDDHRHRRRQQFNQRRIEHNRGEPGSRDAPRGERSGQRDRECRFQRPRDGARRVQQHGDGLCRDAALHKQRRAGAASREFDADLRHRHVPGNTRDSGEPDGHGHRHGQPSGERNVDRHWSEHAGRSCNHQERSGRRESGIERHLHDRGDKQRAERRRRAS